jgi:chemotaxis protein MotB
LARKKKPPEHVNHERWLVSYADFVTLLFAFFTSMYAISTVDADKMGRLVFSMRASFDSAMFPPGSDRLSLVEGAGAASPLARDVMENTHTPKDKSLADMNVANLKGLKVNFVPFGVPKGEVVALTKLRRDVEDAVKANSMASSVHTRMESRGLVVSLGEGGFFASGSDVLKPEGRLLLDSLAQNFSTVDNQIRIEGHTDTVPIRTARFPSNWELSTARATSIISYLVQTYGIDPDSLSAAGYGEFRPIASNDTPEGRARNRRVDIVILNSAAARNEPK